MIKCKYCEKEAVKGCYLCEACFIEANKLQWKREGRLEAIKEERERVIKICAEFFNEHSISLALFTKLLIKIDPLTDLEIEELEGDKK
jgi:hypothetical protein